MSNDVFFVMLLHPNGNWFPMASDDEGSMAFYSSEMEAMEDASANPLGENYGYEIFELGSGC